MTILLNSQLYTGREILLMKGKDQPEITEPTKCYLCDGNSAVGECVVTKVEPYPGFPGAKFAREKLGMNSGQYMDFKGNSEVSGWTVADHQEYDQPVALSSWGINHTPKTWAYSDGVEPEQPAEAAEIEPQDAEQAQDEYQPEYTPEQQEGYVEPAQDTYQQEGSGYQGGGRNRKRGRR